MDPPVVSKGDCVLVTGPGVLGLSVTTEVVGKGGFDVVIECSGSAPGSVTAFRAARPGARYVQVGIFGKDVALPFDTVLYKELIVTSGFASTATSWQSAMRLIEQRLVTLGPLITTVVPLSQFAEALHAAETGEGLKTVVVPTASCG